MSKKEKTAISPTREEDYPNWYQQVIKSADLAESSSARGCMVIKPWGYGIWEKLQADMDRRIKATGHENAYFPLFIPLRHLEREAEHVEGFAKECAVVTHHRLESRDGSLVPTGELEEPYIVRPTSETIIGESFASWVQSYRDLPLLINQWANVVRWEMRPRLFLRTAEFLWQEGHTAHATSQEAEEETMQMLKVYQECVEETLALPVIPGEKTPDERFPGAENTFTIEAMMQDRKALQAGTSHFLGQNFAKAFNIRYLDQAGELQHAYTTSWGTSTRLIGALIMGHSDDDGLRVPPKVAPKHVVVLPVTPKEETRGQVLEYAEKLVKELRGTRFADAPTGVVFDDRDIRGGEKNWQWIKKGIPVRIEVGPRDVEADKVVLYRRDQEPRDKEFLSRSELVERLPRILEDIQDSYLDDATQFMQQHTVTDVADFGTFCEYFTPKNEERPELHGGFLLGKWSGDPAINEELAKLKVTVRCLPLEQSNEPGKCIVTGKDATLDAIYAKAY